MSTDRKMYGTGLKSLLCLVAVVSPTVSQMPDPATGVVTGVSRIISFDYFMFKGHYIDQSAGAW